MTCLHLVICIHEVCVICEYERRVVQAVPNTLVNNSCMGQPSDASHEVPLVACCRSTFVRARKPPELMSNHMQMLVADRSAMSEILQWQAQSHAAWVKKQAVLA